MNTQRAADVTAVVVAVLFVLLPWRDAAGEPRMVRIAGRPGWQTAGAWRQEQGLPQEHVPALHQCRTGYIWAGTRKGLSRFDGVRFVSPHPKGAPHSLEHETRAIVEAADGSLWVALYGGGIANVRATDAVTLTTSDGLVSDFVLALALDETQALWIATDNGVSRFKDGAFTTFDARHGLAHRQVRAILVEPSGSVFVGTGAGVQRLVNGRFEPVGLPDHDRTRMITALHRDRRGQLWVGTTRGLYRIGAARTAHFGPADGLASGRINALHEQPNGALWVATDQGLDRLEPARAEGRRFEAVVRGAEVTSVYGDHEGSVWVGYRGFGLARLRRSTFTAFGPEDGLDSATSSSVLQARDGTVWAGAGRQVHALHGTRFRRFGRRHGLPDAIVSSIAQDADDRLWVGTEAGAYRSTGPARCAGGRCELRFVAAGSLAALQTHIRVMAPARAGGMWIGTSGDGLFRVHERATHPYTTLQGLASNEIRAVAEDATGATWIGTRGGGLHVLREGVLRQFGAAEGLPAQIIQSLYVDTDDVVWVGTREGLGRITNGRARLIGRDQGLHEAHIYGIADDHHGRLWMASGRGLFSVFKRELHDVAEGRDRRVSPIVYGLGDGLRSSLCAVGHAPVVAATADGSIWAATLGGLVQTDPGSLPHERTPPRVRIEQVRVDDEAHDVSADVIGAPGTGSLSIAYTGLSYMAPHQIRFKYKLEGFDADWVDAGSARQARFANLAPGRYRFHVRASNDDDRWSDVPDVVEVVLRPFFYQTAWFRALIVGGGLVVLVGVPLLRLRLLRRRERALSLEVERALAQVKVLGGLLPICAWCKKIRDDSGYWTQLEAYIHHHSQAEFSHGVCPDCLREVGEGDGARERTEAEEEPGAA